MPPSPGETIKEVFKNRLNPKHPLYHRQYSLYEMGISREWKADFHPAFKDNAPGNLRRIRPLGAISGESEADKEIRMAKWSRELEERVYSTTSASDMYINESLKCILAIVKKQQQEINWLKSQLKPG